MILRDHQRLDFLIFNASPPIQALWIEPAARARVDDFIARSVAMITAPSAALIPLLMKTKGFAALISSIYAEEMPANFPHYNAAKAAAEALLRTAVAEYRQVSGVIARPPKLLTDQTNTPLGRKGALVVEEAAARIVTRLLGPTIPGKVEVLNQFS
jgi:NAD(P)-dependent dehydrogenase (short-subunit alcohol dehydrogenase family)